MTYAQAAATYQRNAVMTASPEKLVVMLYDGAIRFLFQAAAAMRTGDQAQARDRLRRAEAIVDELNLSLDMSHGEIPTRLRGIYLFCKRHLIEAHLRGDVEAIEQVGRLLTELRGSWVELAAAVGDSDPRTPAAV